MNDTVAGLLIVILLLGAFIVPAVLVIGISRKKKKQFLDRRRSLEDVGRDHIGISRKKKKQFLEMPKDNCAICRKANSDREEVRLWSALIASKTQSGKRETTTYRDWQSHIFKVCNKCQKRDNRSNLIVGGVALIVASLVGCGNLYPFLISGSGGFFSAIWQAILGFVVTGIIVGASLGVLYYLGSIDRKLRTKAKLERRQVDSSLFDAIEIFDEEERKRLQPKIGAK